MNAIYNYLWDFAIMGIGVFLMYLFRTLNYSNRKLRISTSTEYLYENNLKLKLSDETCAYSYDEILLQNNIDSMNRSIFVKSERIKFLGKYFYLGKKNIIMAIINRINSDISLLDAGKKKLQKSIVLPCFMSYKTGYKENIYTQYILLFNDTNIIKEKATEFGEKGSILGWHLLFSELQYKKFR